MEQPSAIHNTFVIERSYPVTPARVFSAFADAAQKRRWFIEGGHSTVEHYTLDFRVGGKECGRVRLGENTPLAGVACINDATYLNIVPDQRIVFAATMSLGEKCISASLGTVELLATEAGTDMIFTHQSAFFEGADGPEMRKAGWQSIFDNLEAHLSR